MKRQDSTEYILYLSYGKDSLACLEAIKRLGYPLDRIVHAEVWATDTIPADLPPMVEFKARADKIIKERYGIEVEHIYAVRGGKLTYDRQFYEQFRAGKQRGNIYGFPFTIGAWCNSKLKVAAMSEANVRRYFLSRDKISRGAEDIRISNAQRTVVQLLPQNVSERTITGFATRWSQYCTGELKCAILTDSQYQSGEGTGVHNSKQGFSKSATEQGAKKNIVRYLGIAADEPKRINRHAEQGKILPLVDIGWNEAYCRKWCEENDLLSPIYTTATRGGCWFCHNQGVDQLRHLRKNYPEYWQLLLKWDNDSPVTFKPNGITVHHFDKRFELEELGLVPTDKTFRWDMLERDFLQAKILI